MYAVQLILRCIEKAFGSGTDCLGIIVVKDLPSPTLPHGNGFSSLHINLRSFLRTFVNNMRTPRVATGGSPCSIIIKYECNNNPRYPKFRMVPWEGKL